MSADLYHPTLLARSKDPEHFRKLQEITLEAYNPLCGDQFQIFLDIKEGRVDKVGFQGYGCAVSKAASDVILDKILLMDTVHATEYIRNYLQAFEMDVVNESDADLQMLLVAKKFPARIQCAILSSKALLEYFENR